MMPIAEIIYCWMVGWTVKVRSLFIWFILVGGYEKRRVLFVHFMYYVGAVDGLAGMLYMRHVTLAAHLNSSSSVQNISKPTINTGRRSQFIIRNMQFSKIIDSVIREWSKNSLCSSVFFSVATFIICSDFHFVCQICAVFSSSYIFMWTLISTYETKQEQWKVIINRYTFAINNKSNINTIFKPSINNLGRNKCTFLENMIRCEVVHKRIIWFMVSWHFCKIIPI